jgi:hypothetical protein
VPFDPGGASPQPICRFLQPDALDLPATPPALYAMLEANEFLIVD